MSEWNSQNLHGMLPRFECAQVLFFFHCTSYIVEINGNVSEEWKRGTDDMLTIQNQKMLLVPLFCNCRCQMGEVYHTGKT